MIPPNKIPTDQREQIVQSWRTGNTVIKIAKKFDRGRSTVYAILSEANQPMKIGGSLPSYSLQDEDDVEQKFFEGHKTSDIARELKLSYGIVSSILRKKEIVRPPWPDRGHLRNITKEGYVVVYTGKTRNGQKEHRLVMERHLGRTLLPHREP